ncbi:DUF2330 domain-containing protein [Candidatus Uhrbacteria bacterium]|nr:DUF2330 domain-containing protein [Candidatus Uhrbacteria bacterium]
MKLRYIATLTSLAMFMLYPSIAFGCIMLEFVPKDTHLTLKYSQVLLSFDSGKETLVFQPSFNGDAKNFAYVTAFPNKPSIKEAPKELFDELSRLVSPPEQQITDDLERVQSELQERRPMASEEGVMIIEQKNVGDYMATILAATSARELMQWLKKNGYTYPTDAEKNFDFYIKKKTYFFVAVKINIEKISLSDDGTVQGTLKPIAFTFRSSVPLIPMRVAAGEREKMNLTLYYLGRKQYYIPGTPITYSKKPSQSDFKNAPSLSSFHPSGKWLIRHNVKFDPKKIQEDLLLQKTPDTLYISPSWRGISVNASSVPSRSGILVSTMSKAIVLNKKKKQPLREEIPLGSHFFSTRLMSRDELVAIPTAYFNLSKGSDTDHDGISDEAEKTLGTDPSNEDSDRDGFTDLKEIQSRYNPLSQSETALHYNDDDMIMAVLQDRDISSVFFIRNGKKYYLGALDRMVNTPKGFEYSLSKDQWGAIKKKLNDVAVSERNRIDRDAQRISDVKQLDAVLSDGDISGRQLVGCRGIFAKTTLCTGPGVITDVFKKLHDPSAKGEGEVCISTSVRQCDYSIMGIGNDGATTDSYTICFYLEGKWKNLKAGLNAIGRGGTFVRCERPSPDQLFDAQREEDVNIISSAIRQYTVDNNGIPPKNITKTQTEICKDGETACSDFIDLSILTKNQKYLVSIPVDPESTSTHGTGYFVFKEDSGRITVIAPLLLIMEEMMMEER